ncbi:MAG TPA: hypothetical protein VGV87_24770 [Blastocatellia bacterium]|nr:hypothetical protein [Blastocatellia bacterium]
MLRTILLLSVGVAVSSGATASELQLRGIGPAAGAGRTAAFGDIVVSSDPVPLGSRSHGYVEYRIVVSNRATQRAHSVRVTIPETSYRGSAGLDEVSRTITVQPASSVVVSMCVPVLPIYGSGLAVTIDGERQSGPVQIDVVSPGDNRPCVFISQGAQKRQFESLALAALTGKPAPQFASFLSGIPATEWSANWLGYSSFDGIVVTEDEMRGMPPDVSAALWHFVECGGTLLILGDWQVPEPWHLRKRIIGSIPTYCVGFGETLVTTREPKLFSSDDWKYLQQEWTQSQLPYRSSSTLEPGEANRLFPVVDSLTVPVRGLFLLMLLFVIVIGPLNLFVLSRKKKKIWLLWTVPTISLITCVAVSGYSLLSEGWSSKCRTAAVTILDETTHRATTVGWSAFYAPLTPGDGLHYGYETELTPEIGPFYGYRGGGGGESGGRSIDWTEDQHLAAGWVSARVPAHLKIRKSEMRRERITLNRGPDGSVTMVNGLGVAVRELWLADWDGKVYRANRILAGVSAELVPQPTVRATGTAEGLRMAFVDYTWFDISKWTHRPDGVLMAGGYLAVLDSTPFLEEGLRNTGVRRTESVVYGIMKKE